MQKVLSLKETDSRRTENRCKIVGMGYIVEMGYMSKCTPFSTRCMALYWLKKKTFLNKVKGMDDGGIVRSFHLCVQVF